MRILRQAFFISCRGRNLHALWNFSNLMLHKPCKLKQSISLFLPNKSLKLTIHKVFQISGKKIRQKLLTTQCRKCASLRQEQRKHSREERKRKGIRFLPSIVCKHQKWRIDMLFQEIRSSDHFLIRLILLLNNKCYSDFTLLLYQIREQN